MFTHFPNLAFEIIDELVFSIEKNDIMTMFEFFFFRVFKFYLYSILPLYKSNRIESNKTTSILLCNIFCCWLSEDMRAIRFHLFFFFFSSKYVFRL
jgi:hypothetical protein